MHVYPKMLVCKGCLFPSLSPPARVCVYVCTHPSSQYVCLPTYLPTYLPVRPSVCLSVCLSVCVCRHDNLSAIGHIDSGYDSNISDDSAASTFITKCNLFKT